jgi:hypothetical protein
MKNNTCPIVILAMSVQKIGTHPNEMKGREDRHHE